jgi:hypothetical protein
VKGSIIALEHIELRPTAKVKGDLNSPALVIHEGARLEGQCSINHVAALEEPEVRPADAGELGNAKVSFFITKRQKAELRARGYDDATISRINPRRRTRFLGSSEAAGRSYYPILPPRARQSNGTGYSAVALKSRPRLLMVKVVLSVMGNRSDRCFPNLSCPWASRPLRRP